MRSNANIESTYSFRIPDLEFCIGQVADVSQSYGLWSKRCSFRGFFILRSIDDFHLFVGSWKHDHGDAAAIQGLFICYFQLAIFWTGGVQ